MTKFNVLVGCENSGKVRDAFAKRGHYSVSCDLLPSEGDPAGMHYRATYWTLYESRRLGTLLYFIRTVRT